VDDGWAVKVRSFLDRFRGTRKTGLGEAMPKIIKFEKTYACIFKARPGDVLEDGHIVNSVVDDVRFTFTFGFDGDFKGKRTVDLNCYVSYKKHLASSYSEVNDYKPTSAKSADANTLVSVGQTEFLRAFDEYGIYLGYELMGKNTDTVNPSSFPVAPTQYGIFFTNNNDRFHKPFHCFSTLPAQSLSPRSVNLSGRELQDFTNLMKFGSVEGIFLADTSASNLTKYQDAKRVWGLYHTKSWFHVLIPPNEREELRKLLTDHTIENTTLKARYANKKAFEGSVKKDENDFLRFMRDVES
jgi:hypothetical protein